MTPTETQALPVKRPVVQLLLLQALLCCELCSLQHFSLGLELQREPPGSQLCPFEQQ